MHHSDKRHGDDSEQHSQNHRGFSQHLIEPFLFPPEKGFGSTGDGSGQSGAFTGLKNNGCNQRNADDSFDNHQ